MAKAADTQPERTGIEVCAGPVVDFRLREHCRVEPEPGTVPLIYAQARSITKCNIIGRQCCMGKIYRQLSIEERTMIQTQLEMGIRPAAIAMGLNRSASTLIPTAAAALRNHSPARPGW